MCALMDQFHITDHLMSERCLNCVVLCFTEVSLSHGGKHKAFYFQQDIVGLFLLRILRCTNTKLG